MTGPEDAAATPLTPPPAGWYPDPAGAPGAHRWWDGTGWTSRLGLDPTAPAPSDDASEQPADPGADPDAGHRVGAGKRPRPPGYERGRRSSTVLPAPLPVRSSTRSGEDPAAVPAGNASAPEPAEEERRPPVRLMAVVAAVAAAVVVAGVVILGNRAPVDPIAIPPVPETTATTATSPVASPSASAGSAASYESESGQLTIGTFTTSLPGAPYLISNRLAPRPPIMSSGVEAAAVVQARYDGRNDWDASLLVGQLDPAMVVRNDASATADKVLATLISTDFSGVKVRKGTFSRQKLKNPGTTQLVILQGRLNYTVPKVTSHYDQVSLLVAEMSDGHWIGWVSSRPEKASKQLQAALKTSIDTIRT